MISSSTGYSKLFIRTFILVIISFCSFSGNAQDKNLDWYIKNAPFKMPEVIVPTFQEKLFSIKDYGAVNDGHTLNTEAFVKAIKACTEAGGGKVVVPAGAWLTGPIQLKSNVNLHVERGAMITFTKDLTQYPIIKASSTSSNFTPASPIYAYDCKNIAITGEGIIDGSGEAWRPVKKAKTTEAQWKALLKTGVVSEDGKVWWPSKEAMNGEDYIKQLKEKTTTPTAEDYIPARTFLRPYMVMFVNCDNILLENITLRNSPKFVFYPTRCTNLTMRYVNVFNEWWAQNGDAIDISACQNVIIYKCNVSAGDDGICMKSSRGKSDNKDLVNLKNVLVAGCTVYHGHGGFVIGSNTDGGMQNIYVTDCNFIGTDIGIRVKSNIGRGGVVKDIFIDNIFMKDIIEDAILFDTFYEDIAVGKTNDSIPTVSDKTPEFRDFHISNVYCNGAKTAITLRGLPEMPVNKLFFSNIIISSTRGLVATNAADIDLKSVKILSLIDPVYDLKNVKNLQVAEGTFPEGFKTFIKADKKSSGIKVVATDLRKEKKALDLEGI